MPVKDPPRLVMVDTTRASPSTGDEAPLSTVEGQNRDGYRALLATSRGLRRDQSVARDQWFARLGVERKAELLFELEVILKGLACFANPRNHPGPPRRTAIVAMDFREPLIVARDGVHRSIAIARTLLGQEERAFIFQRYLEQVTPEDTTRSRFLRQTSSQETPEDALLALRHGFTHALDVLDALVKQPKVPFRTYFGILSMI